jgi:hypothetical protein
MPTGRKIKTWPFLVIAFTVVIYLTRIHVEMVDFDVYRTAADRALSGENLYRATDGHYQYKYLPAFAFAMVPFAKIDFNVARLIWYAITVGILCVFIRWSVRALPGRRLGESALVWAAILLVGKYYGRELNLGQTNLLLGMILIAALMAAERGSATLAGVLVGIGVFVKPYALILVPWVWLVAGIPGLVGGTLTLAGGLLLPALTFGWQGNIDQVLGWYRTVTATTPENLLVPENISLATMWAKWIEPGSLATKLAVATSVAVVGVAALIFARRRTVGRPAYLEFSVLMLLIPLLSPQGWDYVLLLATPAMLILVDRWRELSWRWRAFSAVTIVFFSFTIFDVFGRYLYTRLTAINIVSIAALALLLCLTRLRWQRLA